jgi:adenine/guanine phosphoribosyltransferase-like PRPP-binding protein
MVAGGATLGAGIMLIRQPEAELASVIPAIGLAFLAGGTGITIGLIRKTVNQVE